MGDDSSPDASLQQSDRPLVAPEGLSDDELMERNICPVCHASTAANCERCPACGSSLPPELSVTRLDAAVGRAFQHRRLSARFEELTREEAGRLESDE